MTCSSIKSSAAKTTGRFNEKLQGYGIDLEYSYRLWKNHPTGLYYTSDIVVYMHRIKSLMETLSDFEEYGRRNAPVILKENPELAPYLGADFVLSPKGNVSLKGVTGALLINPAMTSLARLILHVTPYPLSNFLIRYLMVSSLAMGYRDSLRSRE